MRILIIAGASRAVVWFRKELINYLQSQGNEVVVVACDNDNKELIESYGVKYYCTNGNNRDTGIFSNLSYIGRVNKLIKDINPNKILTFQAKANTFGVIASKIAGYKDITAMVEGLGSVYNNAGLKHKIIKVITNVLYKIALYKIPTIIFLNDDNKQRMLNAKLVKENQCLLINGIGVDIDYYVREQPLGTDVIKFVMIARVQIDKGIIEYCEAARKIIESGIKNVEFNYYGNCDTDINPLDKYKEYVNYYGYTTDIRSVLENNTIVVLLSYHEGVPRSIMEACAMGNPIIATDIPGCKVCVNDGENGKLVKLKSIEDVVQKMEWYIDNKSQINTMGQASRNLAETKFDSNFINQQIYERISR